MRPPNVLKDQPSAERKMGSGSACPTTHIDCDNRFCDTEKDNINMTGGDMAKSLKKKLKTIGKESSSKAEVLAMLSGHISKAALIAAIEAAAAAAVEQLKLHAEDPTKAASKEGSGKKSKKKRKSKSKEMTPAAVAPHDNGDSHD